MREQLIKFETAKLAKEKGFDWECLSHYGSSGGIFQDDLKNSELMSFEYSTPTQSLLQKWLREEHNYDIQIFTMGVFMDMKTNPHSNFEVCEGFNKYNYGINASYGRDDRGFEIYEEALEQALTQCLKLIK